MTSHACRLLLITNTPPIPSWGGAMTFFRHFCEKDDFEIFVITDNLDILNYKVPYPYILVNHGTLFQRISRTRFSKIPHTISNLVGARILHPEVLRASQDFKPDAVFTVGGSWSWMAILAHTISRRLKKPLIGSFNDWWSYNCLYHQSFSSFIERRFLNFYQACDLVLNTSEGMYEALGTHRNNLISYPTGAIMNTIEAPYTSGQGKKVLAFGGNLGEWYGRMIEEIVMNTNLDHYEFKIFGSNASWSSDFDFFIKEKGFYFGQVSFAALQAEMLKADGLLLLMGFGEDIAQIESTSFKTKFLDYLTFRKPIFLWGPKYCSAYRTAEEFDCAARSYDASVKNFVSLFDNVFKDDNRIKVLLKNCIDMYNNRFHPEIIHKKLVDKIAGLKYRA